MHALPAKHGQIGERLDDDEEIPVEIPHPPTDCAGCAKRKPLSVFSGMGPGRNGARGTPCSQRGRNPPAAAVRRGKGLMQIQVDAVKAHVARTNDAHDGVQIRAVIIAQTARVVDDLRDFEDVLVENTDRIGVREHQSRRLRPDGGAERREIDAAVCAGRDIDHVEACHDGRGRIRAVGGVRDDDLCPAASPRAR